MCNHISRAVSYHFVKERTLSKLKAKTKSKTKMDVFRKIYKTARIMLVAMVVQIGNIVRSDYDAGRKVAVLNVIFTI